MNSQDLFDANGRAPLPSPIPPSDPRTAPMPTFRRPGRFPPRDVYPHQAGELIEQLRRFIGHDRLVQQTAEYRSTARTNNGIVVARLRDNQPLIEAFEEYEKATRTANDRCARLAANWAT